MMGRRIFACVLLAVSLGGAAQARQAAPAAPAAASAGAPGDSMPAAAPVTTMRPPPAAAVQPFSGPAAGSLMQTIFGLCVVLGLLALFAWAMKRYGPKAGGGSSHIRMVGGLNLGGRERIIVVEVGDQWIVVGASPGRVNALATMPRQANTQAETQGQAPLPGAAELHPHQKGASSFSDWLKQTIERRDGK